MNKRLSLEQKLSYIAEKWIQYAIEYSTGWYFQWKYVLSFTTYNSVYGKNIFASKSIWRLYTKVYKYLISINA